MTKDLAPSLPGAWVALTGPCQLRHGVERTMPRGRQWREHPVLPSRSFRRVRKHGDTAYRETDSSPLVASGEASTTTLLPPLALCLGIQRAPGTAAGKLRKFCRGRNTHVAALQETNCSSGCLRNDCTGRAGGGLRLVIREMLHTKEMWESRR